MELRYDINGYLKRIALRLEYLTNTTRPEMGVLDDKTYLERITDAVELFTGGGGGGGYIAGDGINITGNILNALRNPTNTYTKAEVDAIVAALNHAQIKKVDALPATGEEGVIYLVPQTGGGYEQYIWGEEGGVEQFIDIGPEDIDLSDYVTETELATELATKQDTLSAGDGIDITSNTVSAKTNTATQMGIVPAPGASTRRKVWKINNNGQVGWFDEDPQINTNLTNRNPIIGAKNTIAIYGELDTLEIRDTGSRGAIINVIFTSGNTPTVVTLPTNTKVPEGFEIKANKTYELSYCNGLLLVGEW